MNNEFNVKRKCVLLLFISLLVSTLTLAQTDGYFWVDNLRYWIKNDSSVWISKNNDKNISGDLLISESVEYNGTLYSITGLSTAVFKDCQHITSLTIPNSVNYVQGWAFENCTSLTSLTLPNSIYDMGAYVFAGCSSLTTVSIPNNWSAIPQGIFCDCSSLNSIIIPDNITFIWYEAFKGCVGLTSLIIPNSVGSIFGQAFQNCTGLTSINLPNNLHSIGYQAFKDCKGLTTIIIPNSVISIGFSCFEGCTGLTSVIMSDSLETIPTSTFEGCTSLTSITIPSSVTSIGKSAFRGCTNLISVIIPANVKEIDSVSGNTFSGCTALKDIYCYMKKPVTVNENSFSEVPKGQSGCKLHVPAGSGDAYRNADVWKEFYIVEDLPSAKNTQTINWNQSSTTIGIGNRIELSATATSGLPVSYSIKTGNDCGTLITSEGKTYLKGKQKGKIVVEARQEGNEDYISTIMEKEFTVVDLPPVGSEFIVEEIVYRITSDNEVKVFGYNEINGDVIIPDKVNYPGSELEYSVKNIGDRAFYDCTGMTSITIPSSVKKIGTQAFRGCTGMTDLTIGNGVETIGYAAFELCTNLTSASIPNSVTYIDAWAFTACSGLKAVLIPSSVTTINYSAFDRCNSLEDIYCYIEEPITITENTFSHVPKGQSGCKLHVPVGSADAYRNADVWKEFYIVEDLTTSLKDLKEDSVGSDRYYTLDGIAIDGQPTKAGVYILNGKKVIVK